mmetsp:Transcript_84507/g.234312  ORF Transcript_84507/g.234312 Transcript_84507/m.234312 type:complete len:263 (-) Transcript_84507:258-1046(-)
MLPKHRGPQPGGPILHPRPPSSSVGVGPDVGPGQLQQRGAVHKARIHAEARRDQITGRSSVILPRQRAPVEEARVHASGVVQEVCPEDPHRCLRVGGLVRAPRREPVGECECLEGVHGDNHDVKILQAVVVQESVMYHPWLARGGVAIAEGPLSNIPQLALVLVIPGVTALRGARPSVTRTGHVVTLVATWWRQLLLRWAPRASRNAAPEAGREFLDPVSTPQQRPLRCQSPRRGRVGIGEGLLDLCQCGAIPREHGNCGER